MNPSNKSGAEPESSRADATPIKKTHTRFDSNFAGNPQPAMNNPQRNMNDTVKTS
jgi:hypothetical protein